MCVYNIFEKSKKRENNSLNYVHNQKSNKVCYKITLRVKLRMIFFYNAEVVK